MTPPSPLARVKIRPDQDLSEHVVIVFTSQRADAMNRRIRAVDISLETVDIQLGAIV